MSELTPPALFVPPIDHPAQPDWFIIGREVISDKAHLDAIRNRFEGSMEDTDALLHALGWAAMRADTDRQRYESEAMTHLRIWEDADRLAYYRKTAGQPEKVGEFIRWFIDIAGAALEHPEAPSRVGLELGGMRQAGDWQGTKPLDDMAKTIPTRLQALMPDLEVATLQEGTEAYDRARSYVLEPFLRFEEERYNPDFKYALLHRSRKEAATISLPEGGHLEIKKRSDALVVVDWIDKADRKKIQAAYRSMARVMRGPARNTMAAKAAGAAFERARVLRRERSHAVIPVSAHYYMVMYPESAG